MNKVKKKKEVPSEQAVLNQVKLNAAGIDLGSQDMYVAIIGSPSSTYSLFVDDMINGETYSLHFSYSDDYNYSDDDEMDDLIIDFENGEFVLYTIHLQSLNYENYLYYTSFDAQNYYNNVPLVESIPVYSNIENGMGFFGSYSSSIKTILVGKAP